MRSTGCDQASAALPVGSVNSEQAAFLARQLSDGRTLEAEAHDIRSIELPNARQHTIADAERRLACIGEMTAHHEQDFRTRTFGAVPNNGLGDQVAFLVTTNDLQNCDGREGAPGTQSLPPPDERAFLAQLGEQTFQLDTSAALDTECARNLALTDLLV